LSSTPSRPSKYGNAIAGQQWAAVDCLEAAAVFRVEPYGEVLNLNGFLPVAHGTTFATNHRLRSQVWIPPTTIFVPALVVLSVLA
jgi:hypothetical protein